MQDDVSDVERGECLGRTWVREDACRVRHHVVLDRDPKGVVAGRDAVAVESAREDEVPHSIKAV